MCFMEQAKAYSCVSGERSDSEFYSSFSHNKRDFFLLFILFQASLAREASSVHRGDLWQSGSSERGHSQHPAPVIQKKTKLKIK